MKIKMKQREAGTVSFRPDLSNPGATALPWLLALGLACPLGAQAINTDPQDFVPASPGTTLAVFYFDHNRSTAQYQGGQEVARDTLRTDIGIARFVHYVDVAGFRVGPQILLPAVQVDVQGKSGGVSGSGLADPILAAPVWLVNRPESRTYFAIAPYLHLPLGQYDKNKAVNVGQNRWKFTLQPGLSVGIGDRATVDVIADVQFFGKNNDLAGGGSLEQKPLYSLQPQFSYRLTESLQASLGAYRYWGGETKVGGVSQGDRTATTTLLAGLSYWVTKTDNLQIQYRGDTAVDNGAKTQGLQFRILHAF